MHKNANVSSVPTESVRYYSVYFMKIPGGEHINQCIHFLNQSSATFKKWWNEPQENEGLSRKEQFQQLLENKKEAVKEHLGNLEKYIKTALPSRYVKVAGKGAGEPTRAFVPEGSLSKVVAELDAVLKKYSTKPLPRPPAQSFPKAMHLPPLPPKPLPKPPQKPLPTPPPKPVPPIPLSEEEAASNIAALKQALDDALPPAKSTFQTAKAFNGPERGSLHLAQQRTVKPQRPLPPVPEEAAPLTPQALAPTDATKPARVIPPRRKPPERTNKNLSTPATGPSIPASKPAVQTVKGPSEAQNQDISRMMQALVKIRMDKVVLKDILLGDKGTLSSNPERQLRAIRILKERGIISKGASKLPALDNFARDKSIELLGLLEANERKLQANVDSWYEKNGGGIQF